MATDPAGGNWRDQHHRRIGVLPWFSSTAEAPEVRPWRFCGRQGSGRQYKSFVSPMTNLCNTFLYKLPISRNLTFGSRATTLAAAAMNNSGLFWRVCEATITTV